MQLDRPSSANSINACGEGVITIGGRDYRRSLIVSADTIVADWPVTSTAGLRLDELEAILALAPEVLLLGTGSRLRFPPHALYAAILERRIGFEVMDTAAACRTFNVLLAEERRVAAALVIDAGPD